MTQSKTEHVLACLRTYAEAYEGKAKSPSIVMTETGASRNLVWTCTSTLRQIGIITTEKAGREKIDRDMALSKISEASLSFGRPLHVGEIKSLFSCSYVTARKLRAEYMETVP